MSNMYQLNDTEWPGMAKVVEESGELGQVIGKIMSAGGSATYPWDSTNIPDKLNEECGDLLASLLHMVHNCPHIDEKQVLERTDKKMRLFREWAAGNHDIRYKDIE